MANRTSVALFGASGLVGRECLRLLLEDDSFDRVVAFVRRPLGDFPSSPKLQVVITDFDHLDRVKDLLTVNHVICTLGTTIGKAGSQERFRQVDFNYPFAIARMATEQGVSHFLFVSSLGANARSRVFYNRVKGELEEAVLSLPFKSITIVRPSLLVGERKEFRFGEEIGKRLAFLVPGRYKPVQARAVASALVQAVLENRPGKRIIESDEIRSMSTNPR